MKAKKAKSSKVKSLSKSSSILGLEKLNYDRDAKAVVSLFILLLALGILLVFTNYRDQIMSLGNFQVFMLAAVASMAFLIGLLFLISKERRR